MERLNILKKLSLLKFMYKFNAILTKILLEFLIMFNSKIPLEDNSKIQRGKYTKIFNERLGKIGLWNLHYCI